MRRIQKVLFPTHFRNLSYSALEQILPLSGIGMEEVVFLHVMDRDEVGFVPFGGFDKELAAELRERADLTFADWGANLTAKGIRWREVVAVGNPEPKILEVAGTENADLIILGRHKNRTDDIYPGGVEIGVVRDSAIPVLLLPQVQDEECWCAEGLLKRILLATDLKPGAGELLDWLASMGSVVESISLLHVIHAETFGELTENEASELETTRLDDLKVLAAKAAGKGPKIEVHLLTGEDIAEEILNFSLDHKCTSIAMRTSGRRGLKELLTGSVSHRVAIDARLPVLLVPKTK